MELATLLERIKKQLAYEYHDEERQIEELEKMTVLRLLEMLEYMVDD